MSEIKYVIEDLSPKFFNSLDKYGKVARVYDTHNLLVDFYIHKGFKARKEVSEIFEVMNNKKYAKSLVKLLKSKEKDMEINIGLVTLISDFIDNKSADISEEVAELYNEAIDLILKKRIKKVTKKIENINPIVVKNLLVVVPDPGVVGDNHSLGFAVRKVLKRLYAMAKSNDLQLETPEKVYALFAQLFGEERNNYVAVNILLERKEYIRNFNESQLVVWNLLTNFALEVLEAHKKKALKEVIEYYIMRRTKDAKKNNDAARRIQFAQLSPEDFPTILKVVEKLKKDDNYKDYL